MSLLSKQQQQLQPQPKKVLFQRANCFHFSQVWRRRCNNCKIKILAASFLRFLSVYVLYIFGSFHFFLRRLLWVGHVYLIICLCSFVFFPSPCFIFLGFFIFPSSTVNILNFTLSKLSDYTITVYLYLLLFSFFFNNLSISCIAAFCLLLFISLLNKLIFVFINNYCSHIFDYFLFSKFFFYSISGAILNRSLFLPISQRDSFE